MLLDLLTRLLIWGAVGLLIYWVLLRFIPRNFLTWFGGAIILALIVLSFIQPTDQTIGAIWQVLSLPLTPLGASILLLVFAVGGRKLTAVNGRYVVLALLILLISSIPLVARSLANQTEQAVAQAFANQRALCADICPVIDPVPFSLVSRIVVAGDSIDTQFTRGGLPSQVDEETQINPALLARLNSTGDLYNRLRAAGADPIIVVTAGSIVGTEEQRVARDNLIRQRLGARGVPAEAIRVEQTGMDIHQAAVNLRADLEQAGLLQANVPNRAATRVVLVAPALTMRRSALTFEQQGMQVVAWPTDLFGRNAPEAGDTLARLTDLVPNVEALRLTSRYWEELLTSIYYFLRGWLPPFNVQWSQVVETVNPPPPPQN